MKRAKPPKLIALTTSLALLVSVSCSGFFTNTVSAAGQNQSDKQADKIAHHLRQRVNQGSGDSDTVKVVVQLNGPMSERVSDLLSKHGAKHNKHFANLDASVPEVPLKNLNELASLPEVSFVAHDDDIVALGHVSSTTGADDVRNQTTSSGASYTLDGTGIGIAIIDSGVYTAHKSLSPRVVYSKDFTGENRTDDPYGHGTHVASAAAGNASLYNGGYTGIAPNANIINLRVLDSDGQSTTAQVLAALDWVYANRAAYNIKVVNLSLGAPAISSYKYDPLCLAVRKLANAGIVVVAAAGNEGKDEFGRKLYGGIHAPGNEPSAITVGSSNSFGTNSRSDDTVTSYSSRGPTRSFWTSNGVRHYDNLIKPDLIAPGNKLIFAESPSNFLVTNEPDLDTGLGPGKNTQKMMYLSGSSVSAPLVSGAAALLLQANPKLMERKRSFR